MIRRYFWNILVLASQAINTILFAGDPDETLSSRAFKNRDRQPWRFINAVLDFIDPGHGARVVERDEGKDSAA